MAFAAIRHGVPIDLAREIGLVSERGRLLVFDHFVHAGPGGITRAAKAYAERYPLAAQDRPSSDRARISAIGDIIKADTGAPSVAMRVDTIVTGRGSIRGVSFDLDQLGVSDQD